MPTELAINALSSALILCVSVPILYIALKVRAPVLRLLSILLSSFLIIHGTYHLSELFEAIYNLQIFGVIADTIVEPASYVLFLAFALYLAHRRISPS